MKTNPITYFEARRRASFYIEEHHKDKTIADYLLKRRLHWNDAELLMHYRDIIDDEILKKYQDDVHDYVDGMPPQYIIGTAPFFGMDLIVNSAVLIPRIETEELVEWVLSDNDQSPLKVLDLGTGSGAIALALKANRSNWQITASDISEAALKVAKENADNQQKPINFVKSDLFSSVNEQKFDIIVSNPPYISKNEVKYMGEDVIEHEPHLALFADNDGLLIYQRIADYLGAHQRNSQTIYLEIGFHQGPAVKKIFQDALPKATVTLKKDVAGNDRMIRVRS